MIDINNLTIGQVKEIASLTGCKSKNSLHEEFIGKKVICRTYSAGVHFGVLLKRDETEALLENAQRIWRWSDAFTLSEISKNGLGKESKISETIDKILLTQVIEIIPCTDKCVESINKIGVYKP